MQRIQTIHKQMVIRIVITVTMAITIITMFSYDATASVVQAHVQRNMRSQVELAANEFEAIIRQQKALVSTYADMIAGAYDYTWKYTAIDNITKVFTEQSNLQVFGFWFIAQSDYINQGKFASWYGMNRDGNVISHSVHVKDDASLATHKQDPKYSYYHEAVRKRGTYITYPYRDPYLDIPMLSITKPIFDEQGNTVGVAGIDIRFQDVQQYLVSYEKDLDGRFLLTTKQGVLLSDGITDSTMQVGNSAFYSDTVAEEVRQSLVSGKKSGPVNIEEHSMYMYAIPIEEPDWIAVMLIPVNSTDSILVHMMQIVIISLVVTVVVVILLVYMWVNKLITKPLGELVRMTKRISRGDYSQSVHIQVDNEWKLLGDHMNQMLLTLQHQASLEHEMKRISALKVVGEMAAAISHEIRNPLTTVRGFLQLLRNKPEHREEKVFFDTMIEEILRANAIITEYLTLAQNKYTEFKPQSLNFIIEQMHPLFEVKAAANCQFIKLDLKPIPIVAMDQKEMRQLLHNLIGNGLDAMPINEVLHIRTWQEQEIVVLEIEDAGKGFDPTILQHAGTPFMTDKTNGTGLGLAICYSIVNRLQGTISIQSEPGCTIIHIELPSVI